MTTYLMQILTPDFELQLKTEVTAETIFKLQMEAKQMLKKNTNIVGMTYRVFELVETSGRSISTMIKQDTFQG